MARYHINKHGVPAPCRAKKGNCPLGGDESHFDNKEDAQIHADKQNESKFSFLPKYNHEAIAEIQGYGRFKDKDVHVDYDGKSFEGKVIGSYEHPHDTEKDGIIIQDEEGNVKHIKKHRMEREPIDITGLDPNGAARKRQWEISSESEFDGPYVYDGRGFEHYDGEITKVKYDGKTFVGKTIGVHFDEKGDPMNDGIIIEGANGEVKHIKAKRLEEEPSNYRELSDRYSGDDIENDDETYDDYAEMRNFEFMQELNEQETNINLNNEHLNDINPNNYGYGGNMILKAYRNTQHNYPESDEIIVTDSPWKKGDLEDARRVIDKGGVSKFSLVDQGPKQKEIVNYWQDHGWEIVDVNKVEIDNNPNETVNGLNMRRIESDGNNIKTLSPGEKTDLKEFLDDKRNDKSISDYELKNDSIVVNGKSYKTLHDLDEDVFL